MSVSGYANNALNWLSNVASYQHKVACKFKTITQDNNRALFFLQLIVAVAEACVPKSTLFGRVTINRFISCVEHLDIVLHLKNLMRSDEGTLSIFATTTALVAESCALLSLAHDHKVICLKHIVSDITLSTIGTTSLIAMHLFELLKIFYQDPEKNRLNRYLNSAYHGAAIATCITFFAGATLFPAQYTVARIALPILKAGFGFAATYYTETN